MWLQQLCKVIRSFNTNYLNFTINDDNFFPLDIVGYIDSVSPNKASQKSNTLFDIQIQEKDSTKKICVMANSNTSRNFFMGKYNSKTPLKSSGINDASGTLFFNSNTASHITELSNINFKYKPPSITKLGDFKNTPIKKIVI